MVAKKKAAKKVASPRSPSRTPDKQDKGAPHTISIGYRRLKNGGFIPGGYAPTEAGVAPEDLVAMLEFVIATIKVKAGAQNSVIRAAVQREKELLKQVRQAQQDGGLNES